MDCRLSVKQTQLNEGYSITSHLVFYTKDQFTVLSAVIPLKNDFIDTAMIEIDSKDKDKEKQTFNKAYTVDLISCN